MTRKAWSSTRTRALIACGVPVQCEVGRSDRRSAVDQMEKYGSCVMSGTAGGRNTAWVSAGEAIATTSDTVVIRVRNSRSTVANLRSGRVAEVRSDSSRPRRLRYTKVELDGRSRRDRA